MNAFTLRRNDKADDNANIYQESKEGCEIIIEGGGGRVSQYC